MKALLSEDQYQELYRTLPQKMQEINTETIHTTRYRPGDVRLRKSPKTLELVCKEGDVTKIARKEIKIPLDSTETVDHMAFVLDMLQFKADPPWTKHKKEYTFHYRGFDYVVCLQHIEKFAYILEVEFLSDKDDSAIHEPNLRAIIKYLGAEPINPQDFSEKIKRYIKENKVD